MRGVINVYHELHNYNREEVIKTVEKIYDRLLDIFKIADRDNISTQEAAKKFAEERMQTIHQLHSNYIPR